jgi:hypothetical protein
MKTAIMQPYIFPYIGYYQLMNAVDIFVILDDVNFIMRGWINRNNILLNNKAHLFSISLDKPSQNKLICDTKLNFPEKDREKLLKTFQFAYKKAPYFKDFYPILEEIILFKDNDLTGFIHNSFSKTCAYTGIQVKIIRSSEIKKPTSLKAEDRIIEICKILNTEMYVNLSGGKTLYHQDNFAQANIELRFVNTLFDQISYNQYTSDFVPNLSFLDIVMFNSKEEIKYLLNQFTLQIPSIE